MIKIMKRYGKLRAQGVNYVLLRPLPFEPEYTVPGTDAFYVGYDGYGQYPDGNWYKYGKPHIVYVKGGYVLDMDEPPFEDVDVYVKEEKEAEPIYNIQLETTTEDDFWYEVR